MPSEPVVSVQLGGAWKVQEANAQRSFAIAMEAAEFARLEREVSCTSIQPMVDSNTVVMIQ